MLELVRTDFHSEVTPSGAVVKLPQVVKAAVKATQSFVRTGGEPLLREGDSFDCEHRPQVGVFQQPLPNGAGQGQLRQAGQQIVRVNRVLVATLNGTNEACSEGLREMDNRATAFLTRLPILKINGSLVVTGSQY